MTDTWRDYRPGYVAHLERLVYVDTLDALAIVQDVWQDAHRAVVVATVRAGINLATAAPFLPAWDLLAWEVLDVDPTPAGRYLEAARQGHLRARERQTGERGLVPLPRQ